MPRRLLHLHSTFELGGKEARAVRLMNAFGDAARHTVLTAVPGAVGARDAINAAIRVDFPEDAPSLAGLPGLGRYRRLARYMAGFDLVLSYNWGAMDGVMARRLFAPAMRLPPLVHHEDGFNADEADGQLAKRVWFRRLGLGAAHAVAVPSHTLERIARRSWWQGRVERIANGIDVAAYGQRPEPGALPGFERRAGELVIGTVAGLRGVKALDRLIAAMTSLPPHVRLVIVGDGPERPALVRQAASLGLRHRVLFTGFLDRPARFVGHFDLLALSSLSEQQPIAVIEGMAAGLPVAATDVGDVARMVAPENRPFVVSAERFAGALATLAADADLRMRLGLANQAKARADYDADAMISRYGALYDRALGTPTFRAQAGR